MYLLRAAVCAAAIALVAGGKRADEGDCWWKPTLGKTYDGTQQTTKNGKDCQRWDSQSPHATCEKCKEDKYFPDATLSEAKNYCRNPDGTAGGPWCYTTDPAVKWESCGIPTCPGECWARQTMGNEYSGTKQVTTSGKDCQSWDSESPHATCKICKDASNFPEATLSEAKNYCRNPDMTDGGPWCYTTDPAVKWESCGIMMCPGSLPPVTACPAPPSSALKMDEAFFEERTARIKWLKALKECTKILNCNHGKNAVDSAGKCTCDCQGIATGDTCDKLTPLEECKRTLKCNFGEPEIDSAGKCICKDCPEKDNKSHCEDYEDVGEEELRAEWCPIAFLELEENCPYMCGICPAS